MLLVPLGLQDRLLGRPHAVLLLIALNVALYLGLSLATDESQVAASHGQLISFLRAHPHLELPPEIAEQLDPDVRSDLRVARSEALGRGAVPTRAAIEAELAELDGYRARLAEAGRRLPLHRFAFKPAVPAPLDLVTSMFLHAGLAHLFFNMLFLWVCGPFLEAVLGPALFLALYLVSGIVATCAHWATFPGSTIPLVGASGAIAGLMGAFTVRLGTSRIRFLLVPSPVTLELPALVVFPLWLCEQLFEARQAGSGAGVAFLAHVGGFLFGASGMLAIGALGLEERRRGGGVAGTADLEPLLVRARRARERGALAEARAELERALAAAPGDRAALEEAVDLALAEGGETALVGPAVQLLEKHLAPEGAAVLQDWLAELRQQRGADLPPALALAAAAQLGRLAAVDAALAILEGLAAEATPTWAFRGLVRGAELLRRAGRRPEAREWYERARRHPACTGTWPATLDAALAELRQPAL